MTILQRLEAFRDLIRHGNALLGEVVSYCRQAESAVNQLAADKLALDAMRTDVEQSRARVEAESTAARDAMSQVDARRRELDAMHRELLGARDEMEQYQRAQKESAETLERGLAEAKEQQSRLEQELLSVRTRAASSHALDARLAQVEQMQTKLRLAELELTDTRHALEQERSRRDRAIALIRPKPVKSCPAAPER